MKNIFLCVFCLLIITSCFNSNDEFNPIGAINPNRVETSSKNVSEIYFDYSADSNGCRATLREQGMQQNPMRMSNELDSLYCNSQPMTEYRDIFGNYRYEYTGTMNVRVGDKYIITFARGNIRYDSYVENFSDIELYQPIQNSKISLDQEWAISLIKVEEKSKFLNLELIPISSTGEKLESKFFYFTDLYFIIMPKINLNTKITPAFVDIKMDIYNYGLIANGIHGRFSLMKSNTFRFEVNQPE